MSISGIKIYQVKSIDEYWCRLENSLELLMSYLKSKHEYGTSSLCSEYGVQLSLAHCAAEIAKKQNINVHKTKCICMAVGLCFPKFGSYGMAACKKYIKEKNIPLCTSELKIGAIEWCINNSGSAITSELDEALHAYYANSTEISEVNVARFCQIKAKKCRTLMRKGIPAGESMQNILCEAEEAFSVEGSIMLDDDYIEIPDEIQDKVQKDLDELIEWDGVPNGIYEFITI